MDGNLQQQLAFYLTGRRGRSALTPLHRRLRPALLARYGDLTTLRYDFPLVLNRQGPVEQAVQSLSRLVDAAVESLKDDPDRDRIARHGYRLERELRAALKQKSAGDFATLWQMAAKRLNTADPQVADSAKRLWAAFKSDGELADADATLPARAVTHAWQMVQSAKAAAFRKQAERLLLKLRDILAAEVHGSRAGWTPERLKAGVGSAFAASFNFNSLSKILVEAKPGAALSDQRRARIQGLVSVLERQRFYPLGDDARKPHTFAFARCSDALKAYQERHEEAVELVRTLAVAELEVAGDYREAVHDVLFEGFGENALDARQLAQLPDYLVYTNSHTLDAAELSRMTELLAAGLPIKVLVQTDDVLEPAAVVEGHVALGWRARQLVNTAISLTDVFVLQGGVSQTAALRGALLRGLQYNGPALFSVFSGVNGHTGDLPAYLVAAAAVESRAFPTLIYDPSAGATWAARLNVKGNPRWGDAWPVHALTYEDDKVQSFSAQVAFTLADFMALDDRFFDSFAVVPRSDWNDGMIPLAKALESDARGLPTQVPCITLIDEQHSLQRAVVNVRTMLETRRCAAMWHSLQELGGIHNSHAEYLLEQERQAQAAAAAAAAAVGAAPVANATAAPASSPSSAEAIAAPQKAPAAAAAAPESNGHGDAPYIESERCSTCNECINRNAKMFQYNANKQAFIADVEAGSFRQLVEAAEGCQLSIIHPGKPRNPKEPGLEELLTRAAAFK